MLSEVRHSMLPFDKTKGPSQKIMFTYTGRLYQVYWLYNHIDETVVIRINDYHQLRIVMTARLVDQGVYIAKDSNGIFFNTPTE